MRRGLLLGWSLLLAALALPAAASAGLGEDKLKAGDRAPDFATRDLAGKEVGLPGLAGKSVLLLNFWGLRCGACLEEMPYLDVIAKKYGAKGLVTWGVNTDGADAETIKATLKSVQVSVDYPLLLDTEFTITDTYTNFLVPLTLVIDRKGVITYIHTGFEEGTEKAYEAAVVKALAP